MNLDRLSGTQGNEGQSSPPKVEKSEEGALGAHKVTPTPPSGKAPSPSPTTSQPTSASQAEHTFSAQPPAKARRLPGIGALKLPSLPKLSGAHLETAYQGLSKALDFLASLYEAVVDLYSTSVARQEFGSLRQILAADEKFRAQLGSQIQKLEQDPSSEKVKNELRTTVREHFKAVFEPLKREAEQPAPSVWKDQRPDLTAAHRGLALYEEKLLTHVDHYLDLLLKENPTAKERAALTETKTTIWKLTGHYAVSTRSWSPTTSSEKALVARINHEFADIMEGFQGVWQPYPDTTALKVLKSIKEDYAPASSEWHTIQRLEAHIQAFSETSSPMAQELMLGQWNQALGLNLTWNTDVYLENTRSPAASQWLASELKPHLGIDPEGSLEVLEKTRSLLEDSLDKPSSQGQRMLCQECLDAVNRLIQLNVDYVFYVERGLSGSGQVLQVLQEWHDILKAPTIHRN